MTDQATDNRLETLFGDLVRAKQDEKAANARRIACEEAILSLIADRPDKGSVRLDGGPVRATIKFDLSYKANLDAMTTAAEEDPALAAMLPVKLIPATAPSYEFDEKAYESLRERAPGAFARFAQFVETKPKKPAFELKLKL